MAFVPESVMAKMAITHQDILNPFSRMLKNSQEKDKGNLECYKTVKRKIKVKLNC